jgi:hypothetical protein
MSDADDVLKLCDSILQDLELPQTDQRRMLLRATQVNAKQRKLLELLRDRLETQDREIHTLREWNVKLQRLFGELEAAVQSWPNPSDNLPTS